MSGIAHVKRSFLVLLFLALALAAMVISLVFGSADITMAKIWHTLWSSELKDTQEMVIWNIRFPRNIVAALVGANLAVAGAILQAVMKNPLADPADCGCFFGGRFGRGYNPHSLSELGVFSAFSGLRWRFGGSSHGVCLSVEKRDSADSYYFGRGGRGGFLGFRDFRVARILW